MSAFHEEANHPFERAVIFGAQQCPFFGFDSTNLPLLVEGDLNARPSYGITASYFRSYGKDLEEADLDEFDTFTV